jgi:Flp pilus assembly pilin Flp
MPFVLRVDTAAELGVASALISIAIVIALTWVGLAARTSNSIHFHCSALNHEGEALTSRYYLRSQRLEKNGQVASRLEDVDTDVPDRAGS